MDDVKIVHVFQPASDTSDLASKWKINKVAIECKMVDGGPGSTCRLGGSF